MATTFNSTAVDLTPRLYIDLSATSTAQTNITGVASSIVYYGEVDNRMNPDRGLYFKLFNHASPSNATNPTFVFYVSPASIGRFVFPEGLTMATAVSFLVSTSGLVSQGTSPTNKAVVKLAVG
jgi:hypothetical protein